MVLLIAFLVSLSAPASPQIAIWPCPAALIIDVGGWHQATVMSIFREYAPGVSLTAISAVNASELANAIDAAAACKIKVVNISLSVACDCSDVRLAVERAVTADVLIVAASGNDGPSFPTKYPAAYPGVLSVMATDTPSNPGRIAAVAWTSFASPVVAGTAARIRLARPALSAAETADILIGTAKNGVIDIDAALWKTGLIHKVFIP